MEETLSLKDISEVIKKRLLLIVAFMCGAAIIAAIVSYFLLTPTYESNSQFIVNQGQQDPSIQLNVNDIQTNIELINTYNVIIKSNAILEDVVNYLNLSYTTDQLANKMVVSSEQNSQIVTVVVTDTNPVMATKIANATVEIFQDKIPDLMNVDNVKILTLAATPDNPMPISPNPKLNIAIAIVLGGMIGVGMAFLFEYLDNTITCEDDIEKYLGLSLLGVIHHIDDRDVKEA